jgi:hypothetical protein
MRQSTSYISQIFISDTGSGENGWEVRWQHALRIARETLPPVSCCFGRFRNSPWRWALRGARQKLNALRTDSRCRHMICIPATTTLEFRESFP